MRIGCSEDGGRRREYGGERADLQVMECLNGTCEASNQLWGAAICHGHLRVTRQKRAVRLSGRAMVCIGEVIVCSKLGRDGVRLIY